jgi:hypothetical protein
VKCSHDTVRGENGRLVCIACDAPIGQKTNKYGAERHRGYASKKEADTSANLHALQATGTISNLEEQVRFGLIPADDLGPALSYVSDFTFIDRGAGYGPFNSLVVLDAKGVRTPVYKLKRRLLYHFHGIVIQEV